ncbi:hypothetical protein NADE_000601 [Nannochloris sp. 'desiccata']|nr:hypothetical protein NADE_000601 [Chlorella desiccata (nom. nud.)]
MEIDLKPHVDFFDRLVELIPAKHYLADPDERVDLRHMKKKDRQAAKEQFKKQHKDTKKASLDPSTAKGTLELLKLKSEAEEQARSAGGGGEAAKGPVDREALRAKLQARLEDLRKQRKADEQEKKVDSAKQWRDTALDEGRRKAVEKRKLEALKPSGGKQSQSRQQQQQDRRPAKQQRTGGVSQQSQGGIADGNVGGAGLTFSKVDFGNGASNSDRRKGKHKLSKAELLQEAEKRQAQQGAGGGGGARGEGEEQEAWGAALKRAQGEKVFDDPKLLRKSMKKEAKMKQKKSKVWNERLEKQKEGQEAKQAKRRTNLQRRVDAKKEAKKAKREKKLLRAGFEGRKKTFITTPSPKPPKS